MTFGLLIGRFGLQNRLRCRLRGGSHRFRLDRLSGRHTPTSPRLSGLVLFTGSLGLFGFGGRRRLIVWTALTILTALTALTALAVLAVLAIFLIFFVCVARCRRDGIQRFTRTLGAGAILVILRLSPGAALLLVVAVRGRIRARRFHTVWRMLQQGPPPRAFASSAPDPAR